MKSLLSTFHKAPNEIAGNWKKSGNTDNTGVSKLRKRNAKRESPKMRNSCAKRTKILRLKSSLGTLINTINITSQ